VGICKAFSSYFLDDNALNELVQLEWYFRVDELI